MSRQPNFSSITVFHLFTGLIGITKELNGSKFTLEAFPPGVFEEYSIDKSGRAKLVRQERFYEIGSLERPKFRPFVPYNSEFLIIVYKFIRITCCFPAVLNISKL